jgi:hypothetical protein
MKESKGAIPKQPLSQFLFGDGDAKEYNKEDDLPSYRFAYKIKYWINSVEPKLNKQKY